jgi:hypothetical protein
VPGNIDVGPGHTGIEENEIAERMDGTKEKGAF